MDKAEIERYKEEMIRMYSNRIRSVNVQAPADNVSALAAPVTRQNDNSSSTGGLIGVATAVRGLYFVPNTRVTVFKGTVDNMDIIDSDITDQNGRTKEFLLDTPVKSESLDENNTEIPYALYNMMFESDGYMTNIHLNIPVFPSVTSRQTSNLLLLETAGVNKGPRIFDESQNYNL